MSLATNPIQSNSAAVSSSSTPAVDGAKPVSASQQVIDNFFQTASTWTTIKDLTGNFQLYDSVEEAAKVSDQSSLPGYYEKMEELFKRIGFAKWAKEEPDECREFMLKFSCLKEMAQLVDSSMTDLEQWVETAARHKDASNKEKRKACIKNIIDHFKEHPEDINFQDENQVTPLHTAAGHGDKELVEILLGFNPNTELKNCFDQTPAMRARGFAGNEEIAELIEKHGRP